MDVTQRNSSRGRTSRAGGGSRSTGGSGGLGEGAGGGCCSCGGGGRGTTGSRPERGSDVNSDRGTSRSALALVIRLRILDLLLDIVIQKRSEGRTSEALHAI